jgi:hypothetical protein
MWHSNGHIIIARKRRENGKPNTAPMTFDTKGRSESHFELSNQASWDTPKSKNLAYKIQE